MNELLKKFATQLLGLLGLGKNKRINIMFWNFRARDIHQKWGTEDRDLPALKSAVSAVTPATLLDIGCGGGRFFSLYKEMNVKTVVAQDISVQAILLAKERPASKNCTFVSDDISELRYPDSYFDLIVSNRALSAVYPNNLEKTMKNLCRMGKYLYINELTDSDYIRYSPYWFKHDYSGILKASDYIVLQSGYIPSTQGTWFLYKKQ